MDNININGQNIILGLDNENTDFHASIYPNPTKGIFSIRTDANSMKVEVYSTLGRLVAEEDVVEGLQRIDLSNQAKGIYFVRLTSGTKIEQRKLIVQ